MKGWQLHLEKAYPSWETPTEKYLEDNFHQNKMVVLKGTRNCVIYAANGRGWWWWWW